MEQKDYILREIEKIGLILIAIKQKLFGGKENLAITIDKQMEETKDALLTELKFDIDNFLSLDKAETEQYLAEFEGFNAENIEHLADIIFQIGFAKKSENYLKKSLQLYEFCIFSSKTFSLDRERRMEEIRRCLGS